MSWPLVKLGDLCNKVTDGSHNPPKGIDISTYIMLSSKNVFDDQVNFNSPRYLTETDYNNENKRTDVSVGDVLLTIVGTVGRAAVVKKEHGKFTLQRSVAVLKPNKKIESRFLMYCLRSMLNVLVANSRGVAQKGIYLKQIKELEIPLPPLAEQKRIATILDKADAIRQKRKQAIKLADDFLRSVFLDMFGDPVTNPKGWEVKKLKDITIKLGSGSTPRGGKEAYLEEGISLIRSLNIHNNRFTHKNLAFISDSQAEKLKNVVIEKDDLLLNITGASVCRATLVDNSILPARVNQHVCIVRAKSTEATQCYLARLITSNRFNESLMRIATAGGATREALTKQQVENLEIILPPLELQVRFENIVQSVTAQVQKAKSQEKLPLFNSLSQKAFAGDL